MITENNTESVKANLDAFLGWALDEVGMIVRDGAKEALETPIMHRGGKQYPTYDTGDLHGSITFERQGTEWVRIGTPKEYAIYIEKGAKAHWTSVNNLLGWVSRKFWGMTEKEQTSIAYAIQRNMSKEDMPPMPFLEPGLWNNLDKVKRKLGGREFDWKIVSK